MRQCFAGVSYIHHMGIFHRDLKPENLLWSEDNELKVADFGLSKQCDRNNLPHTNYVSTRWYRAPEIMLKIETYDPKVDIFALGCIMAELYTGQPLFPGTSETDMLIKMTRLLGDLPVSWSQGNHLMQRLNGSMSPEHITKEQQLHQLSKAIP